MLDDRDFSNVYFNSMFQRRPLRPKSQPTGGTSTPKAPEPNSVPRTQSADRQNQQTQKNNRPGRNQNPKQRQNQSQKQNPRQKQNQSQNLSQAQSKTAPNQQQNRRAPSKRPPPPPPAYFQRDLLLVTMGDSAKAIEEVRLKFDPMAKKLPAHVTLIFPEPAVNINKEFLKNLSHTDLPHLAQLTFSSIIVHDEMYLWLIPDQESTEKLKSWHAALIKNLTQHTQEEVYQPHITLGYLPRSINDTDAISFAGKILTLPLTLNFEKILFEEFSENQISSAIDSINFQNNQPIEVVN